jgi:hypothetical protein
LFLFWWFRFEEGTMGSALYTNINEDAFQPSLSASICVLFDIGHLLPSCCPIFFAMLTCPLQASSYAFNHPPYASDDRTSRSLRTLLQTLPPVCSNTRLRNTSRHISGTHLGTRPLHLDTFSFNCHSSISTLRSLILLLSIRIRKPRPEHPSPATDS